MSTPSTLTRQVYEKVFTDFSQRAASATEQGFFQNELVPVNIVAKGKTTVVSADEEFTKINFDKVPTLKPAFDKNGTVTAANASTLNDGASALVLASSDYAKANNLKPLARIVCTWDEFLFHWRLAYGDAETAPVDFPLAPALAIPVALQRAGLKVEDIDFWEINEAFSVVALANVKLLNLDIAKVNVNGGGVSLGHPIGYASMKF